VLRRLVHKADFERLLSRPAMQRSAHFACHFALAVDLPAADTVSERPPDELSTSTAAVRPQAVDNFPGDHWLGVVVPKRHARRSVTRSLVKRQLRAAFARHAAVLPAGHWLLRLKAPYAAPQFVSAASPQLAQAVREELDLLLHQTAQRHRSGAQASGQTPGRRMPRSG
jgi:ribonuclease P protein component